MFVIDGKAVTMNKGDFGTVIKLNIPKEIDSNDIIRFLIFKDDEEVISKDYTIPNEEKIQIKITLTESETSKLKEGIYSWGLVQYQKNKINNTILIDELWKVENGYKVNISDSELTQEQIQAINEMECVISDGNLLIEYDESILNIDFEINENGELVVNNNVETLDFNINNGELEAIY